MEDFIDADLTLPSVAAVVPTSERRPPLVLTIVFHPDVSRIGEAALVPRQKARTPWILGRKSPLFEARDERPERALEDRHVSRQALELDYNGHRVIIRRPEATSRCRVAGTELRQSVELDQAELLSGVSLMLGHGVVLLLRFAVAAEVGPAEEEVASTLLGSSRYMRELRSQLARAASSELDVLIRGETGTGKELVAGAIHAGSRRARSSFVTVNMAAIPGELAPAALFGSARGSFTGAREATKGYFEQAQGGSLFLDEVGDTPTAIQPQLLRAVQQREIQRVGGAIQRVDLRIISATDAAIEGEASQFKAALRHRLGACEIHLLPLREHPEDIGELMRHFLTAEEALSSAPGCLPDENTSAPEVAAWADFFHRLLRYRWPGNVRELANFAGQVVLSSSGGFKEPANIARALRVEQCELAGTDSNHSAKPGHRRMQDVGSAEFARAFQASYFEVTRAARQLGVSRQSVYRYIEESPVYRLASEVSREELQCVLKRRSGSMTDVAMELQVSVASLRARLSHLGMNP